MDVGAFLQRKEGGNEIPLRGSQVRDHQPDGTRGSWVNPGSWSLACAFRRFNNKRCTKRRRLPTWRLKSQPWRLPVPGGGGGQGPRCRRLAVPGLTPRS